MGGVIISRLYNRWAESNQQRLFSRFLIVTGILLIAAGLAIRGYADGISKIRSTPAWVFICGGITILMFQLFIYLVDSRGKKDFLKIIRPAGTSTLTCYLLPYYLVFMLELFHIRYGQAINEGIVGLLRAFAVSFILIWIAGQLEKRRIRLKI
jgi:predicted acyltransferase